MDVDGRLKEALQEEVERHDISGQNVTEPEGSPRRPGLSGRQ